MLHDVWTGTECVELHVGVLDTRQHRPAPLRPPLPLLSDNPLFSRFISYPRTETEIFKEGTNLEELVELQTGHHMWGPFAQRLAAVSCAFDDAGPARVRSYARAFSHRNAPPWCRNLLLPPSCLA